MEKMIDASFVILNVLNDKTLTEDDIIVNYNKFTKLSKPVLNIRLFFCDIKSYLISKGLIECLVDDYNIKYKLTDYGKKVLIESMRDI